MSKVEDDLPYEERIQRAIEAVLSSGGALSVRQAARDWDVSNSTLADRIKGNRKPRREAHAGEQKLTPLQELVLVEWVKVISYSALLMSVQY